MIINYDMHKKGLSTEMLIDLLTYFISQYPNSSPITQT